ncbi:hypothetical protein QQS21_011920 [Conoideocrella luteorostrata]|uniref:Uncharacterized protein n=1 Tax=Conoideocrella luteorostrata TaxID=1105319 RepID=A0AAJ0FT76_9HYPO|nr:hypothetical protein QQS21_011920 [Conoideocrella luteorostrata]
MAKRISSFSFEAAGIASCGACMKYFTESSEDADDATIIEALKSSRHDGGANVRKN